MTQKQAIQKAQIEVTKLKSRMLESGRDPKEVELCVKDVIRNYPKNVSMFLKY